MAHLPKNQQLSIALHECREAEICSEKAAKLSAQIVWYCWRRLPWHTRVKLTLKRLLHRLLNRALPRLARAEFETLPTP